MNQYYYFIKSILHSDFLSFYLVSFLFEDPIKNATLISHVSVGSFDYDIS